jgi:multidrug efflux pump subunit AcrB
MNFSAAFIRRPIATTLLTAAVALAGIVAFTELPVSPLPQVDFPTISVSASLPGASPEIMASSVSTPLEREFGRVAGVTEMTAQSTLGQTSITLQFDLSRNIDAAARDVESAINAARSYLPANLPNNPTYRKVNPADAPIMIVALTSDKLAPSALYDAASTILQQRLSQIAGVGQVIVGGSSAPAVRINVNPTQLNSYGLQLEDVRIAIAAQTANEAKGSFADGTRRWEITANDQLLKAADYQPLIVSYRSGAPVRLSDVANVADSVQTVRSLGLANGRPAALIIIFRQPGANIISTVDGITAALPQLHASINPAITLTIALDQTATIRASVKDIERTLLISIALVVLVVFLFLREVRSTMIPLVAVPVSIIGTLAVMYLFGYSIDNLSLMALTISTGFVVDDAIVVLENITRYQEGGMDAEEASYKGAAEIGSTVLSMSLSLVAVFIPILLMGGIIGRLFREFAIVLSVTILVSLAVSLTTTPMMCSQLLSRKSSHGRFYLASEKVFERVLKKYEQSLGWVLEHSMLVLIIAIVTVALNVYLYIAIPKGFFPQQDTGMISGSALGAQDVSTAAMRGHLAEFAKIVAQDPDVTEVGYSTGNSAFNTGNFYITLKPRDQRTAAADQIVARLRPKLATVVGATLYLQVPQDIRVGGRSGATQYQYTLQDSNLDELNVWAPKLVTALQGLKQLADVTSDQQANAAAATVTIDRDRAARFGVQPTLIDATIYDAIGQRQVVQFFTQINAYHVVLEVDPALQTDPRLFDKLYLTSPVTTKQVPVSYFMRVDMSKTAYLVINHQSQFPAVTISFNLASGAALGDAVTAIQQVEAQLGMPQTLTGSFQGTAQAFQASLATTRSRSST